MGLIKVREHKRHEIAFSGGTLCLQYNIQVLFVITKKKTFQIEEIRSCTRSGIKPIPLTLEFSTVK